MRTRYDARLKAQVTLDDDGRVRAVNHLEPPVMDQPTPRAAAEEYLRQLGGTLKIPREGMRSLSERVSHAAPQEQGVEYRLAQEKTLFDSTTVAFAQTINNLPIWGAEVTVTVKHGPNRVVGATDTSHPSPRAPLPSPGAVGRLQQVFAVAEAEQKLRQSGLDPATHMSPAARTLGLEGEPATSRFVREILPAGVTVPGGGELIRGRLFVYRYNAEERLPKHGAVPPETPEAPEAHHDPVLPLPPVPAAIEDGRYYTVAEITFALGIPGNERLVWLALVEVETNAVLYLRALASGVNGLVFALDPITQSGNAANTPDQTNAVLNPFRASVVLPNLNAPVAGIQSLTGSRAAVVDVEAPIVAAPTKPSGNNFDFNVRTNDFAAVNAYYHVDKFFEVVESLGFPIATYFNATTFPLPADHRDIGNTVNAHCIGNGLGGIGHVGYALNDTNDLVNPIGRACDSRVTWHELGGHGILYEHVNSANFGFAHSAGDSLSVIFHDPESKAPDRFRYAPWNPINTRRCDRDVAAGWAWGGSQDVGGYNSEEILETTMFRVYRSIGGDSSSLARRKFAARATMYLILRAVSLLTPGTNPNNVLGFANKLIEADLLNWTTEGIFGGAYNKVIRWSFEKQGLYQPPGAPQPVVTAGAPPAVDVYIDDGRAGEYQYQAVHWNTTAIWNRRNPDGNPNHQKPKLGQSNFAYVRIKNRGTTTARGVRVKGYHCKPSAGVLWPNDLQPMTTAEINVGTLLGNNAEEKVVGPFEWVPINNAWGHDCMLMIVSDRLDPSNVDQFTVGEVVQDWRLVPNDNNIGQRNVVTVGPGSQALIKLFEESSFWVGNPHRRTAVMRLGAVLPRWLARARWQLRFATASRFELRPGESREVRFRLRAGERFNPRDVENATERDILVMVDADDLPIGGMTYRLEPRGQDDDEVSAARRVARKKVAKRAKRPAKKTARARSR
jgi:zinc metalloprotease ZmpB